MEELIDEEDYDSEAEYNFGVAFGTESESGEDQRDGDLAYSSTTEHNTNDNALQDGDDTNGQTNPVLVNIFR